MRDPAQERAVRYLLDDLSPAERDAFEGEYLGDEALYGELLAAEDDLIDLYCQDALPEEQRRLFERRYLATAEGRQRVAFARTFLQFSAARPQAGAAAPPSRAALMRRLPWAAVVLAVLSATLLAALQRVQARRAREERAALIAQLADEQRRAREGDQRMAELSQRLAQAEERARALADLLGADAAAGGLKAAALALASGLRRDGAAVPHLALTPDLALVRLSLHVGGPPRRAYRASLQTPEGRELWARDALPVEHAPGAPAVAFTVPAAVLAPGQYVVTLTDAATPGGESDAEYVFEVRRGAGPH